MAVVAELADDRGLGHDFRIGVGENDERSMAAKFQAQALHLVGGTAHQLLADFCGAGEADLADDRVLRNSAAISLAEPMTRLATPLRQPGIDQAIEHVDERQGVWLAGLQTIVQPTARAGAILRACSVMGKFHGPIAPTTPTGA